MMFNPMSRNLDLEDQILDTNIWIGEGINMVPVMGGKHYVYVLDHRKTDPYQDYEFTMPAYDAGYYTHMMIDSLNTLTYLNALKRFYSLAMYAGIPMGVVGTDWLSSEAKIRIRLSKPYKRGYSNVPLDTIYDGMDINNYYPMYEFSMAGLETEYNVQEKEQTDLDVIAVVPNPYYAYSDYEHNALDNRVKITNLPERCTITIYNISGSKVKQFKKDTPETTIEWDLKNFAAVPVAGGVYYFHVKSDEGDRVIKWFCVARVPDLNTF